MAAINLCWSSDDDEQPAQAIDLTMSTDSNEDEVEDEIVTLDPARSPLIDPGQGRRTRFLVCGPYLQNSSA